MKKSIISTIIIMVLACNMLCACGNSNQGLQKKELSAEEVDDFIDQIKYISGSCDYVCGMFQILYSSNYLTWEMGWDFLLSGQEPIYNATNAGGNGAQVLPEALLGVRYASMLSSDENQLAEYINTFRVAYSTLETAEDDYKETLKNFKQSNASEDLINALEELYVPLSSYIQLALKPNGTFDEHCINASKYSTEINEILKKVELYAP